MLTRWVPATVIAGLTARFTAIAGSGEFRIGQAPGAACGVGDQHLPLVTQCAQQDGRIGAENRMHIAGAHLHADAQMLASQVEVQVNSLRALIGAIRLRRHDA